MSLTLLRGMFRRGSSPRCVSPLNFLVLIADELAWRPKARLINNASSQMFHLSHTFVCQGNLFQLDQHALHAGYRALIRLSVPTAAILGGNPIPSLNTRAISEIPSTDTLHGACLSQSPGVTFSGITLWFHWIVLKSAMLSE